MYSRSLLVKNALVRGLTARKDLRLTRYDQVRLISFLLELNSLKLRQPLKVIHTKIK